MAPQSRHPHTKIEAAIKHAKKYGWTIKPSKGHAWGRMLCPFNDKNCRCGTHCIKSIWSTPKNPEDHAMQIRAAVDNCIRVNKQDD